MPEGWIEFELEEGKVFYANTKTKTVRWDRPESDPYFLETDMFMKCSRREIKKLKRVYSEMDWDASLKISEDEFKVRERASERAMDLAKWLQTATSFY